MRIYMYNNNNNKLCIIIMQTVHLIIYTLLFLFPILQPDTNIKDLSSSFKQLEPICYWSKELWQNQ